MSIFLPVLVVITLTIIAFFKVAAARLRVAREQERDPAYYRAYLGTPEPEYAIVAVRHYGNLFEAPVLFYAGCISAFVLAAVTPWTLAWAWGYAVARLAQSAVHLTYNNPAHRGVFFSIGWLFLIALWVVVGLAVFSRL